MKRKAFGNNCYCCNAKSCGKIKDRRKTKNRETGYKWLGGVPAKASWRESVFRGVR